jgi:hypothetical protein
VVADSAPAPTGGSDGGSGTEPNGVGADGASSGADGSSADSTDAPDGGDEPSAPSPLGDCDGAADTMLDNADVSPGCAPTTTCGGDAAAAGGAFTNDGGVGSSGPTGGDASSARDGGEAAVAAADVGSSDGADDDDDDDVGSDGADDDDAADADGADDDDDSICSCTMRAVADVCTVGVADDVAAGVGVGVVTNLASCEICASARSRTSNNGSRAFMTTATRSRRLIRDAAKRGGTYDSQCSRSDSVKAFDGSVKTRATAIIAS